MVHDPHKSSDIDRDYQLQAGFNQPNRETISCKLCSSRTIPCHAGDMDKPGRTPSIPRTITVSGTGRRANILPTLWMIRKKKLWLSANFISFRALWGRDRAPNGTRLTVRTLIFCHSIQSNPDEVRQVLTLELWWIWCWPRGRSLSCLFVLSEYLKYLAVSV